MADDKKDAGKEKEAKEAKEAKPAAPAAKAGGGSMGPIIAGVVLLALGAGMGIGGAKVVAKFSASGTDKAGTDAAHAAETPDNKQEAKGVKGLHELSEITLPDLMSNIKNQQGRRYIKVACSVWLETAKAVKMGLSKGGHGGGGNDVGQDIKRIMQQALEEHLKNYDIEELTGPNIYIQLKKGFSDAVNSALNQTFPEYGDNHRFVERIVLTNLLVQ
jgi:flagellar basal body-associated protein FliL